MSLTERPAKGLTRCQAEAGLDLDARTIHRLENTGAAPMRTMIIITPT
jgi:hypothetical protein